MPIAFSGTLARFDGICTIEEALAYQEFLAATDTPTIDLGACTHIHTALLQLLLLTRPNIIAWPAADPLSRFLPALFSGSASAEREETSA